MKSERLTEIKKLKDARQVVTKGKIFDKLTTKEKDALLEALCKMFGLI